MAKLNGKYISGIIGNLCFQKRGNQQIIRRRTVRGRIRQSEATRACSADFGRVSKLARLFRKSLSGLFCGFYDGSMCPRLVARVSAVVNSDHSNPRGMRQFQKGNLSLMDGFDFNAAAPMVLTLQVQPLVEEVSGQLRIRLPQTDKSQIKAPRGATGCNFLIQCTVFNFRDQRHICLLQEEINWSFATGSFGGTQIKQDLNGLSGCVMMIGLSIVFYRELRGAKMLVSPQGNSSAILKVAKIEDTENEGSENELTRNPVDSKNEPPLLPFRGKDSKIASASG